MRVLVFLVSVLACGTCLAAEPIGQSGKPVPTKPNPTFSNPGSNVAPPTTPNAFNRGGQVIINRPTTTNPATTNPPR